MDVQRLDPDNYGSPYAEQLKRGFRGLRFDGLLEKDFREFYVGQNLPRARLSGLIALILVLAVTCIDLLLGASAGGMLNTLRLGILCPLLVVLGVAISVPGDATLLHGGRRRRRHADRLRRDVHRPSRRALGLLVRAGRPRARRALRLLVPRLAVQRRRDDRGHPRSRRTSSRASSVGLPFDALYYSTAILGGAAVIGGISTYNLEYALRTNFLETRVLNELAERDGMTGLYNRRIFDDYVERLWRQSRRESTGVAIIFVDIDFFKVYNDLYGHQAGDDCLKRIAKCIARGAKRPFDFAARYGGEEFVLVLYGPPDDYARSVPEQIRRDVLELAIPHAGSQAAKHVTVSVGLALAKPETSRSLAGAIQTADEALYQAKREGRNRVVFKDSDSDDVETGNFRVIQRDLA